MSDNIKHDDNIGLLTSIWGGPEWDSLCCIAYGYPENPTDEDKLHYRTYFEHIKYVLPCCMCRKHLTEHTKTGSQFEITPEIFESRESLTRWLYGLHNRVNDMLEISYDITYDDMNSKYSSYIADCVMPIEKKIIAYKNSYDREAPFINYITASYFADYAKKRGLDDYMILLEKTKLIHEHKRTAYKNLWIDRNLKCWEQIKQMRTNGILGFESDGEYKNLPTIDELKLLQMMCTTMKLSTLNHMIKKLGYTVVKIY